MTKQQIMTADENYRELDAYIRENGLQKILLVCGRSFSNLRISMYFSDLESRQGIKLVRFSGFQPNPRYESVVEGVALFRRENCDSIIAVGGGSAMDVAKCIKLYSNMDPNQNYLKQRIVPNDIKLIAVPTTAGTGSEATRYAVIYYEGEKQSVTDESCIPSVVLMDASALRTLPDYQRKSAMMDALCHALESYWSVHSTEESRQYSGKALRDILKYMDGYLKNEDPANEGMLMAANTAGRAINITQTTAGHAMSYKMTGLYGISHGHAAALCVSELWPYMASHTDQCVDPRGREYFKGILEKIAVMMGCGTIEESVGKFRETCSNLALLAPVAKPEDYLVLRTSVNPIRLKNNPVALDADVIDELYHKILGQAGERR